MHVSDHFISVNSVLWYFDGLHCSSKYQDYIKSSTYFVPSAEYHNHIKLKISLRLNHLQQLSGLKKKVLAQ